MDELNSCVGGVLAALPSGAAWKNLRAGLERIQGELFVVGALLATPAERLSKLSPPFDRGLPADSVLRLEREIDAMTADLKPMTHFILPGGTGPGAWLHLARTVCRRAERAASALSGKNAPPEGVVVYLNRLSDHLFTAARWANAKLGASETPWKGLAKR